MTRPMYVPPLSILLLAANPKETVSLRLHEEERDIKECLRLAGYGKVPINSTGATRPRDIQQAMLDFKPQIVHFSGHGAGEDGLVFEDRMGQGKLVSSVALADLFRLFSDRVECVVLNACYSSFQAEAISQHIDYVIGMSQAIEDHAAIEFAVGFYKAVGAGEPIDFAYELGCNAIQFEEIPDHLTPVLYRKGKLVCPFDLEQVWQEVIFHISFRGTQVLLQQQACLLAFNGREARIGIKSQPLFQMAKKQLPKIEKAFEAVYGRKVLVSLEVTTLSSIWIGKKKVG
jgi:hypothetical protein